MSYNEDLATKLRAALQGRKGVTEKKMFGGLAFMFGEHMGIGILGDDLMVRVGPEANEAALRKPHARPMDFTGRPMKGYIYVSAAGWSKLAELKAWIEAAASFVRSLPAKKRKGTKK